MNIFKMPKKTSNKDFLIAFNYLAVTNVKLASTESAKISVAQQYLQLLQDAH